MAGDRHEGAFVFGVVLGAVASAAATLLLTPRSGDSLRAELARRGRDLQGRAEAVADTVQERSRELLEQGRQRVGLVEEAAPPVTTAGPTPAPAVETVEPAAPAAIEPAEPAASVNAADTALLPPVTPEAPADGAAASMRPEQAGGE